MENRYPSDAADKFMVRMPPGLRQRIADAALAGGRSMNAEIVLRLEQSLESGARGSEHLVQIVEHVIGALSDVDFERVKSRARALMRERLKSVDSHTVHDEDGGYKSKAELG